jgi:hypothetical protein
MAFDESGRERGDPLLGVDKGWIAPSDREDRDSELAEERLAPTEDPMPASADEHQILDDKPGPLERELERPGRVGVDVLARPVAIVADRALDQAVEDRQRRHRRDVDKDPALVDELAVQAEEEKVGRDQMLEEVRAKHTIEPPPKVRQAVLNVGQAGLQTQGTAKGDVLLDRVEAGAASAELDQVRAVAAADVEDGATGSRVGLADEPQGAGWHEEAPEHALGLSGVEWRAVADESGNLLR